MKSRFLTAWILLTALSVFALENTPTEQPVAKGQRVFSAGHSFHFYVPDLLNEVALSAGYADHSIAGKSMIGGSKSLAHWNVKDDVNKTKAALNAGTVDVLTLTPIYLPDEGVEKFAQLGFEHNPKIRVTVQEFWLPFDEYQPHYYDAPKIPTPKKVDHNAATVEKLREMHARYFKEMDELVESINKKLGTPVVEVVPMGQAVIALREKIIAGQAPGLKSQEDLFTDPLGHPKAPLQVLVTYCHFAVIYRKSPVGLPIPKALEQLKGLGENAAPLNRLLQEIAWDSVTHHALSGVKVPVPAP